MSRLLIIIFVVVVIAVVVTASQKNDYEKFKQHAIKTRAEITEKEERVVDQKNHRKEHTLTYTYTDKDGVEHSTQEMIEYDEVWFSIRRGQVIDVYYNPGRPNQSMLAPVLDRRMGVLKLIPSKKPD